MMWPTNCRAPGSERRSGCASIFSSQSCSGAAKLSGSEASSALDSDDSKLGAALDRHCLGCRGRRPGDRYRRRTQPLDVPKQRTRIGRLRVVGVLAQPFPDEVQSRS